MTQDASTSTPVVTLAELIELTQASDPESVEIHVLVDLGYDQPTPIPVKGVSTTTYRNGDVIIELDATL